MSVVLNGNGHVISSTPDSNPGEPVAYSRAVKACIVACSASAIFAVSLDRYLANRIDLFSNNGDQHALVNWQERRDVLLGMLSRLSFCQYPVLACVLWTSNKIDNRPFNIYCAVLGACAFGEGVICLAFDMPISALVLGSSGALLLLRGVTSCEETSELLVKTSACAHRIMRTSFCERVSSNMNRLKNALFNIFNRVIQR